MEWESLECGKFSKIAMQSSKDNILTTVHTHTRTHAHTHTHTHTHKEDGADTIHDMVKNWQIESHLPIFTEQLFFRTHLTTLYPPTGLFTNVLPRVHNMNSWCYPQQFSHVQ